MDYVDLNVRCPRKAVPLARLLTHSLTHWLFLSQIHIACEFPSEEFICNHSLTHPPTHSFIMLIHITCEFSSEEFICTAECFQLCCFLRLFPDLYSK